MIESQQFKSKKDAQHYFELLDIDKNGNVSFSEFFAPLIPQLNKDQVQTLTRDSVFTIEDFTALRKIYKDLKQQTLMKDGGKNIKI